jgi:hypothetical protein
LGPRLLGERVADEARGDLGTVADVVETGGADLLLVREESGRERLVPLCGEIVRESTKRRAASCAAPRGAVRAVRFDVVTLFPRDVSRAPWTTGSSRAARGRGTDRGARARPAALRRRSRSGRWTTRRSAAAPGWCSSPSRSSKRSSGSAATYPAARERVVLLSPQGRPLDPRPRGDLTSYERLVLLCGGYEGLGRARARGSRGRGDRGGRAVVSGGELPAMMLIDGVARQVGGRAGERRVRGERERRRRPARPSVLHAARGPTATARFRKCFFRAIMVRSRAGAWKRRGGATARQAGPSCWTDPEQSRRASAIEGRHERDANDRRRRPEEGRGRPSGPGPREGPRARRRRGQVAHSGSSKETSSAAAAEDGPRATFTVRKTSGGSGSRGSSPCTPDRREESRVVRASVRCGARRKALLPPRPRRERWRGSRSAATV